MLVGIPPGYTYSCCPTLVMLTASRNVSPSMQCHQTHHYCRLKFRRMLGSVVSCRATTSDPSVSTGQSTAGPCLFTCSRVMIGYVLLEPGFDDVLVLVWQRRNTQRCLCSATGDNARGQLGIPSIPAILHPQPIQVTSP